VSHVPWARPGAKCTYLLEDTCAWLAKNMALTAVTVFLRLSWRTVAGIVARVVQDLTGKTDQLDGLTRIGIDEISYRYVGDLCQGLRGEFPGRVSRRLVWRMGLKGWGVQDASSLRRSRSPSNIFFRPTCPLAAASSRWRCNVGRNSIVVTKKVHDSQIDSKWQSISTGRAQ